MTRARSFEWILPLAASVCLLGQTLIVSPYRPMWLDEIYSYYGVAHPSLGGVLTALQTNFNTAPPLYFVVVWALSKAIPVSALSLRIYSSLASGAAFWLVWALLRRHAGFLVSSIAALATLCTSEQFLFHNAEARFYGPYIALIAWAAYNGDRLSMEEKPPGSRLVWNAVSHALAVSCTYVAWLYSVAILVWLMMGDRSRRVWRPKAYLSVVAGWTPLLLFARLMWVQVHAPLIWSAQRAPTDWMSRPRLYAALDPVDLGLHPFLLLCVFGGLGAIAFLKRGGARNRGGADDRQLFGLGFALLAVPFAMLALAWAGLPLLLARYAAPSLIGAALLFGGVSARVFPELDDGFSEPWAGRVLAGAMVAALLAFPLWRAADGTRGATARDQAAQQRQEADGMAIAISDPPTYFLRYVASRESHNIYFVVRDQERCDRVMRFNPRLNPIAVSSFLASHDRFRLVSDDLSREWLEGELRRRGDFAITTEERTGAGKVLTASRK